MGSGNRNVQSRHRSQGPKLTGATTTQTIGLRDEDDQLIGFSGWLLPLRPRGGASVLLVGKEGPFRRLLKEALEQRGQSVTLAGTGPEGGGQAVRACQERRFQAALLVVTPEGASTLIQDMRATDPDLEVVWAPPPISVARAEALVQDAVDRGNQRLLGLFQASRQLLSPLPPEETTARLLEKIEEVLGGRASLCPHKSAEPQQVLLSPDRRLVRVPLWEDGPAPDEDAPASFATGKPDRGEAEQAPFGQGPTARGAQQDPREEDSREEDSGHRLELSRAKGEPELSHADLLRAGLLATIGSLAITRAHCEQALSELYREQEARATGPGAQNSQNSQNTQNRRPNKASGPEADPLAGMGLTSVAIGPLERLAGVLAHELNNPLTFVLANLSCLQDELSGLRQLLSQQADPEEALMKCDQIADVLGEAMGGAGRVREVVSDLTTLGARINDGQGGDGDGAQHEVMIEEVVRAALRIAKREVQRRARVVVDVDPRLPPVLGSASRLGQVMLNLLLNAVQAVPHGDPAANEVRIQARAQGGFVVVSLSDTGSGIPPDSLPRVFEEGYTTKPLGEGSGLGLAISREIVRAHGGEIQIASQQGSGTTVTVLLPAHRSPKDRQDKSSPQRPRPRARHQSSPPARKA